MHKPYTAAVQQSDSWINLGNHSSLWDAIEVCQKWVAKNSDRPLTYLVGEAMKSVGTNSVPEIPEPPTTIAC